MLQCVGNLQKKNSMVLLPLSLARKFVRAAASTISPFACREKQHGSSGGGRHVIAGQRSNRAELLTASDRSMATDTSSSICRKNTHQRVIWPDNNFN